LPIGHAAEEKTKKIDSHKLGVRAKLAAISHNLSPAACTMGLSASLGLVFHPCSMSSYNSGGKPEPRLASKPMGGASATKFVRKGG
jgi:hypothetical protein